MNAKKSFLIAGAVTTIGLASIAGIQSVSAMHGSNGAGEMVEKIASRFNLNQDEVQAVFDEQREEEQAERRAEHSTRLQELVDAGTITAEQKTALEARQATMQEAREAERAELEAWATEQGVDLKYLMGRGHGNGNRLERAVEQGEITEEQKTAIETKQDELEQKRETQREEFQAWAQEQGIDLSQVMVGEGHHGGRGHGRQ